MEVLNILRAISFLQIIILLMLASSSIAEGMLPDTGSEVQWILDNQVLSGAIPLYWRGDSIVPYFTNIVLNNILRVNTSTATTSAVRSWLSWYIDHINSEEDDYNGLPGTIYNWHINSTGEWTKKEYDSTDAYAATFLSLATSFARASGDRSFIRNNLSKLKIVAEAAYGTFNPNLNLTKAKPDYDAYYLMDNVEVWKGFQDFSELLADHLDPEAYRWDSIATTIRLGIENNLYEPNHKVYNWAYAQNINVSSYQQATSYIYPYVFKLPEAMEPERRSEIYQTFRANNHTSTWADVHNRVFADAFVSEAVKLNGDMETLDAWKNGVFQRWFPSREYSWSIIEASYFVVRLSESNF